MRQHVLRPVTVLRLSLVHYFELSPKERIVFPSPPTHWPGVWCGICFLSSLFFSSSVRDIFKKRRNFSDLLNNAKMRDASHAVLDRLIAEWPEGDEEGAEQGYDFYYQPLESDKQGRLPGDEGFNGFNSCFMDILRKKKLYQVGG